MMRADDDDDDVFNGVVVAAAALLFLFVPFFFVYLALDRRVGVVVDVVVGVVIAPTSK
jgi:hypothetical protein